MAVIFQMVLELIACNKTGVQRGAFFKSALKIPPMEGKAEDFEMNSLTCQLR